MRPENGFGWVGRMGAAVTAGILSAVCGTCCNLLRHDGVRRELPPGGHVLMLCRQQGVTMIEIMVVILIISILLAVGVPNFQSWMRNSQIRTAAESVRNGLQLARSQAAQLNTKVNFTLNGNDWSVNVSGVPVSSVFYTPDIGNAMTTLQQRSGKEGTPNAAISAVGATAIFFNSMGRVVFQSGVPAVSQVFAVVDAKGSTCATTAQPNGTKCLNVIVEPGGKIWMCDPALNGSGNPQACAP